MHAYYSKSEFQAFVRSDAARSGRVGLVPTMGALHEGHLSLVRQAQAECDLVAVSIFVNPLQFAAGEDLDKYPRTMESDFAKLGAAGVDAVLVPRVEDIYPADFQTVVSNDTLSGILCGASRAGHFNGVLTVVLKLLNIAKCQRAYFGRKDFQQLTLVKRMVKDLDVDCEIVGCPTVRDPSGLALSSRNTYLSPAERESSVKLSRTLREIDARVAAGERDVARLMEVARPLADDPLIAPEYLEIRSPGLETRYEDELELPAVALIAARVGATRLIDNIELAPQD
ncbi:pantoate--beta-alanine ligase [Acuticoccus sediminis]|uniref:Pantothenate synthetase n=1 Tax=Acuticoccus sediminis TaxID=2184697 RepID=A0A8B2NU85_9HYPH|nr:pantoate--beta-alanine ligase [Acuticoccus sediminis]RAI03758.1 pantoate--beta-alanine ligase [Acuticoccus sediminis]